MACEGSSLKISDPRRQDGPSETRKRGVGLKQIVVKGLNLTHLGPGKDSHRTLNNQEVLHH